MRKGLCLLLFIFLASCASSPDEPETGGESYSSPGPNAHPATYAMDSFVIRKSAPRRPASSDVQFFFKTCELSGDRDYYSKTSYGCTRP